MILTSSRSSLFFLFFSFSVFFCFFLCFPPFFFLLPPFFFCSSITSSSPQFSLTLHVFFFFWIPSLPLSSCLLALCTRQFLELKKDQLKGQEALYLSSRPLFFFFLFLGFLDSSPSPFLSSFHGFCSTFFCFSFWLLPPLKTRGGNHVLWGPYVPHYIFFILSF